MVKRYENCRAMVATPERTKETKAKSLVYENHLATGWFKFLYAPSPDIHSYSSLDCIKKLTNRCEGGRRRQHVICLVSRSRCSSYTQGRHYLFISVDTEYKVLYCRCAFEQFVARSEPCCHIQRNVQQKSCYGYVQGIFLDSHNSIMEQKLSASSSKYGQCIRNC